MSEIERIQKYIDRTKFPEGKNHGYSMCFWEIEMLRKHMDTDMSRTMILLFEYGRAKGYRAAKAKKHV